MTLEFRPTGEGQDKDSKGPTREVLLITQVLVRRDEHLKQSFGGVQQLTVGQRRPSHLVGRRDGVTRERLP